MSPLIIVGVVLLIGYMMSGSSSEVDTAKKSMEHPPSAAPETTAVVAKIADLSHVPTAVGMDEAKIELYTGLDYTGTKRTLYPGMKAQFAEMTTGETINWTYQSMKVVPGTLIMLTSSVGGSQDRGFAVGKYDVPDMFAFIKSYDSIYDQKGIFMDRTYWARPFFIQVLDNVQWDKERQSKHTACMATTVAWGYDDAKGKTHCQYAEPEANMANITGFQSGFRIGRDRRPR